MDRKKENRKANGEESLIPAIILLASIAGGMVALVGFILFSG